MLSGEDQPEKYSLSLSPEQANRLIQQADKNSMLTVYDLMADAIDSYIARLDQPPPKGKDGQPSKPQTLFELLFEADLNTSLEIISAGITAILNNVRELLEDICRHHSYFE